VQQLITGRLLADDQRLVLGTGLQGGGVDADQATWLQLEAEAGLALGMTGLHDGRPGVVVQHQEGLHPRPAHSHLHGEVEQLGVAMAHLQAEIEFKFKSN